MDLLRNAGQTCKWSLSQPRWNTPPPQPTQPPSTEHANSLGERSCPQKPLPLPSSLPHRAAPEAMLSCHSKTGPPHTWGRCEGQTKASWQTQPWTHSRTHKVCVHPARLARVTLIRKCTQNYANLCLDTDLMRAWCGSPGSHKPDNSHAHARAHMST